MHRFWDSFIEPTLEQLRPKCIVEVGSDYGANTKNLIAYCEKHDAKLHVIDPMPAYDVVAWKENHEDSVVFHVTTSLEALPWLDGPGVVLLDGDHNWYTVFQELRAIEARSEQLSQLFPLVMLHDIGWPYGRRDGYYSPDEIPEDALQPFERKGMLPGRPELQEKGGFNSGFRNALREGGARNGVLTAIEDFVAGSSQELELFEVPGLHGLGILVPSWSQENLKDFLETLTLSPNMHNHLQRVEEARLEAEVGCHESTVALRQAETRWNREIEQLREQLQRQRETLRTQNRDLQRLRRNAHQQ